MDWIPLGMAATTLVVSGMFALFLRGDNRKRTQAIFDAVTKKKTPTVVTGEWLPAVDVEDEWLPSANVESE